MGTARAVLALSLLPWALGLLPVFFRASEASAAEEGEPRRLPTARVTAVRPEELPSDPSSFATVIEPDDYQGEAATVERLLDESVGVQVRSFGGPGQRSEITIRGSTGQQVVIRLDGVRLNTAQSGTVDLSTLPLAIVDRIEVSRGGGSASAGSGAIGGVVDVVTRRPTGKPKTDASLRGASFGTWQGSLSHSNRTGPIDWGASYTGFTTDGDWDFQSLELRADGTPTAPSQELERINNDSESHSALVQLGGDLAPGLRLRGWDSFFFVSRGQPGPDAAPDDVGGGQSNSAHERRTRNVAAVTLEADGWERLPDSVGLESTVSYLFERTRFRDPEPRVGNVPIETRQRNRSFGWRTTGSWEGRFLGMDHVAGLQLNLRYDSLSSNDQRFRRRNSQGVRLSEELGLWKGRVQILPTLRFDHDDDFGSEWVPHLGLIVSPFKWLRLKGNAERAYRVPDFDELYLPDKGFIRGNPNLDPEDAWSYDAGFELGFEQLGFVDDLRVQWAWFYQDIENSIVFQRISPQTVAPTNTNDAEVDGFELAASFSLLGWVELSGNWTHQDGDLDRAQLPTPPGLFPPIGQSGGTAIPGQADDEYQIRVRVGPESGLFKLVGERRYTSKIRVNFSDTASISSRTLYDLSGSVDLAQLWRLDSRFYPKKLIASVGVTNLTDQSVRDSVGFPQPGRALFFGVEGSW